MWEGSELKEAAACLKQGLKHWLAVSLKKELHSKKPHRICYIAMHFFLDISTLLQDYSSLIYYQLKTRSNSKKNISPCRKNSKNSLLLLCLNLRLPCCCCRTNRGQNDNKCSSKENSLVLYTENNTRNSLS